jgi:hypothetical protein
VPRLITDDDIAFIVTTDTPVRPSWTRRSLGGIRKLLAHRAAATNAGS